MSERILKLRSVLGAGVGCLILALFAMPYDARPAYALLAFLALAGLAAALGFGVLARDPGLWRRWRLALASPAVLYGAGFAVWGMLRWSAMPIAYAGRPWVIGLGWLSVGLALGTMLGTLDRAAEPALPGATAGFRRVMTLGALVLASLRLALAAPLPAGLAMPSSFTLLVLLAFCAFSLAGRGEGFRWFMAAAGGFVLTALALLAEDRVLRPLTVDLPYAAARVYWPAMIDHILWGTGPGSLTLAIANRLSFGPTAALAVTEWRYRLPAELGLAGMALLAGFLAQAGRLLAGRSTLPRNLELSRTLGLTFFMILLGSVCGGLERPESMALLGLAAGLGIGLADHPEKLRPYAGRLAAAVALLLALGTMACAMTIRNQVAWRYHLRGLRAMGQGRWLEAADLYGKAYDWQPDNPEHSIARAMAYARTIEQVGLTSPYLIQASYKDPMRADIPAALARWMADRGRTAEAAVQMAVACELDPGNKEYQKELRNLQRLAEPAAADGQTSSTTLQAIPKASLRK